MINLTETPEFKDQDDALATLAILYPHAFAMVAISDSPMGQALQRWRAADLNRSLVDQAWAEPFPAQ